MTKHLLLLLLISCSSLTSQTVSWQGTPNDLGEPIKVFAVSPDGELFAGWDRNIYMLDSTRVWENRGTSIPGGMLGICSFGFSRTAAFASFPSSKEFYRSTDKGKTWQQASTGLGAAYVVKFASSGDTVFAMPARYFYRSTDNGATWAPAIQGLAQAATNFDLCRLDDGRLLLATYSGMFYSTDNAAQWKAVEGFPARTTTAIDQSHDGAVIAATDSGVYRSIDRGQTWSRLGIEGVIVKKILYADTRFYFLIDHNVYALAGDSLKLTSSGGPETDRIADIGAAPDGSLYASHGSRGVYKWDHVRWEWEELITGFKNSIISMIATEPGREYAGVQGKGVFYTEDMGIGWTLLLPASKNPKAMLLETPRMFVCDSAAIYRTTDGGVTWQRLNPVPGKGASAIVRSGEDIFISVEGSGVYRSTNNGETWEARGNGIGNNMVAAFLNIRTGVMLAAAQNGIYKTIDAGATWVETGDAASVGALIHSASGAVFAGASDGAYRSMDEGVTWKKLDSIGGPVLSIAPLGISPNVIASTPNGIFISSDLGGSWKNSAPYAFPKLVWNGSRIVAASEGYGGISYGFAAFPSPSLIKWLPLGALQTWYAGIGCEPDRYRVDSQQDGLCYPAIRPNQDMQASKGLWIGYVDPASADQSRKSVIFAGPRGYDDNTFIPYKFSLVSMVQPPKVMVSNAVSSARPVEYDRIDGLQKSDLMLENNVYTSSGIEVRRKIYAFSQQYHDNYNITEYTYVNSSASKLTGVYFYHLYRWAINADTRYVIGNATGWGVNTMIDSRGDGLAPANTFFPGNKDNDIRAVYAWHGKYPAFPGGYDNVGGPIFVPYTGRGYEYQQSDTVGRLGASQFVGVAVLHADKSSRDTTDDMAQPATMSYESADSKYMNQFPSGMYSSEMYELVSKGRAAQRHADKTGPDGDPMSGSVGGWSAAIGFGPYTLEPGDSIHVVLTEAAAGIDEETALRVGRKFKYGQITAAQKNDTVYTGRDSLFQTFRRAIANYHSGYMIPQPPLPPKTFSVNAVQRIVKLEWTTYSDNDPKLTGFDIYRSAGTYYAKAVKVASCSAEARTWSDSACTPGEKYFYYITSVGRGADNTGIGMTPPGSLQSSRYYTQTWSPVSTVTAVEPDAALPDRFALEQNYPNPFNPSTSISFSLPSKAHVTVRVFDALGRMVSTIVSETLPPGRYTREWNASGFPSGMYFYRMQAGSFTQTKRLVILK